MTSFRAKFLARVTVPLAAFALLGHADRVLAHDTASEAPKPATVEFYYRVKWGYFEEFLSLYKKNHYPILKRLQDDGRILKMHAAYPVNHAGENDRWDMRFTIVFADPKYTYEYVYGPDLVKELYPDQDLFKKEEQRRFELLLEHMDVPVRVDDLSDWDAE